MASVRAFVALEPSQACKDELAGLRERLRRIEGGLRSRLAWSSPETWHLTLKFLGDVAAETLPLVIEALAAVPFVPFTLQPGGGGFFPPPGPPRPSSAPSIEPAADHPPRHSARHGTKPWGRPPRVIWVGLDKGAEESAALAANVESALIGLGFPPEERPFAPHLTIARVKVPERDPWEDMLEIIRQSSWPEAAVTRFTLWKSELGPGGAKHAPLATFGESGTGGAESER